VPAKEELTVSRPQSGRAQLQLGSCIRHLSKALGAYPVLLPPGPGPLEPLGGHSPEGFSLPAQPGPLTRNGYHSLTGRVAYQVRPYD